ncbi:protease inhibitor Epi10 [Phytophthora cinnamomi]|uniref:protease inhibitor Epi10 n=1 Tax=Phytophthora cinnamomi TaxID=4785 RepID=UPI002A272040|nr:protease inhibitor Epi10 [Phytophthora cinnamomi]KAJ8575705.1 hypothetical protein ON010_g3509 [Phytophthora cinnamomi]
MKFSLGLVLTAVAITSTIADDTGEETCGLACSGVYNPVTDENGAVYFNECSMQLAKCRGTSNHYESRLVFATDATDATSNHEESGVIFATNAQRKLAFAPGHKGGACEDMLCPDNYAPVCGSDGVTYSNECNLGIASCNHPEKNITQVSDGECASTPAPSPTPSPKTSSSKSSTGEQSCDFLCLDVYEPVTDENGVQYSNECYMRLAKCRGTSGDSNQRIENPDITTQVLK